MPDADTVRALLADGDVWGAARKMTGLTEPEFLALAREVADTVRDRADTLDMISDLVYPPPFPPSATPGDKLRWSESARMLGGALAVALVGEDWQDLLAAIRELAVDESRRVQEMCVRVVARVAGAQFESSRSIFAQAVHEGQGAVAACVLRGLAQSSAPAPQVIDMFSTVIDDIRRDVRHGLGPRAIPELGRREPQAVYAALWQWTRSGGEIARWNVAHALATHLGGVYIEQAVDILDILAADERPSVWRAAAAAVAQVAQRRPSYVLPVLSRWRTDPSRAACARLALESLARR